MSSSAVRSRKSVVVFVGSVSASDCAARALARSLTEFGIGTIYVEPGTDARGIALAAVEQNADAVEICVDRGTPGVPLLRALLRQLVEMKRRDVSIVVHRL